MEKFRISAVRYANTYPFIYGLTECGFDKKSVIETDHPSDCAAKVISGRSDLGLIPVATIPLVRNAIITGEYCIGSNGRVRTVQLMSNSSPEKIKKIYLDFRSGTSVKLIKVIARNFWGKEYEWAGTSENFDFLGTGDEEAVVLIGDQCFELENEYTYKCDLAEEWKKHTGLPFVFACWIANRDLPQSFTEEFNNALSFGVGNIDKVVERFGEKGPITGTDLKSYLTENIDFNLNEAKKAGMNLFLELLKKL